MVSWVFHPCPYTGSLPFLGATGSLCLRLRLKASFPLEFLQFHVVLAMSGFLMYSQEWSASSDEFHLFHHTLSSITSEEHSDHLWRCTLHISTILTVSFLTVEKKKKERKKIWWNKTEGWMWIRRSRKPWLNLLLLIGFEPCVTRTWIGKLFCGVQL